jgi:5-methylcytosine-specific restriction endonuclease McrA
MKRSRINFVSKTRRSRSGKPGHTGKVRLYGADLESLRWRVYLRDLATCQLKKDGCRGVTLWERGHMHHVVHRSLGGSDSEENCVWSCPSCHNAEHCPKACPKK